MNSRGNGVIYGQIGDREELQVIGIGDRLFKSDEKAIGEIC